MLSIIHVKSVQPTRIQALFRAQSESPAANVVFHGGVIIQMLKPGTICLTNTPIVRV